MISTSRRPSRVIVKVVTCDWPNPSRLKLWPVRYDNLPVRSCFIDGEAIVVDASGLSVFELIRYRQRDSAAVLCAFDLIELNGKDLRRSPIEDRKTTLAELLRKKSDGIALNAHYEGDGANIYKHACALGCEGIVSKRLGSPYRSGRVSDWLKIKNPAAPAVKREAEEDWGGKRKASARRSAGGKDTIGQGPLAKEP